MTGQPSGGVAHDPARPRLRIVEEGGKATVRMILPVALFILPVLFVVLLAPAALELMHLGG